jgi:heme/copper-type cytochrome/quinol oxidase subunit 2
MSSEFENFNLLGTEKKKGSSPWATILVGLAVVLFLVVAIISSYLTYRAYRADYSGALPSRYKNEVIATTVLSWIAFIISVVTLGMMMSKRNLFIGSMIGIILAAVFSIISGSVIAAAANEVRGLDSREPYRLSVTSAVLSFIGLVVLVLASVFILINSRRKQKSENGEQTIDVTAI